MLWDDFFGKGQIGEGKPMWGDANAGTHTMVEMRRKCVSELEWLLLEW